MELKERLKAIYSLTSRERRYFQEKSSSFLFHKRDLLGNAGKGSRIGCLFLFRKVRVLDIYTDRVEGDGK